MNTRLPHCTTLTAHNPLCDRDGTFCGLVSTHEGQCDPHGSYLLGGPRYGVTETELELPETEAEKREAWGK